MSAPDEYVYTTRESYADAKRLCAMIDQQSGCRSYMPEPKGDTWLLMWETLEYTIHMTLDDLIWIAWPKENRLAAITGWNAAELIETLKGMA